jgi:hypothetical protein
MASHGQLSYNLHLTLLAATVRRQEKKLSFLDYCFYGLMVLVLVVLLGILIGPGYLQW